MSNYLITISIAQEVLLDVYGLGENQHTAYLHCDNRLKVVVEGHWCDNLILKTDNGRIQIAPTEKCTYLFFPVYDQNAKISIYTVEQQDTLLLMTKTMRVSPLPFVLNIGGKFCVKQYGALRVNRADFIASPFYLYALNTNLNAKASLKDFTITIIRDGEQIYQKEVKGYNREVDKKLKKDLAIVSIGDLIRFKHIKYQGITTKHHIADVEIEIY